MLFLSVSYPKGMAMPKQKAIEIIKTEEQDTIILNSSISLVSNGIISQNV
jgi:hypothetical protein